MAALSEESLCGDDVDAIIAAIDGDFFLNECEFDAEINDLVKNIPLESKDNKFKCYFCDKVCISKRGLTRHVNCKHKPKQSQQLDKATCSKSKSPEEKMHPLLFKYFLEVSAKKLSLDECYPSDIMDEFKAYSFRTLDDVLPSYNLIRDVVDDFQWRC